MALITSHETNSTHDCWRRAGLSTNAIERFEFKAVSHDHWPLQGYQVAVGETVILLHPLSLQ